LKEKPVTPAFVLFESIIFLSVAVALEYPPQLYKVLLFMNATDKELPEVLAPAKNEQLLLDEELVPFANHIPVADVVPILDMITEPPCGNVYGVTEHA
jgi:hypothetical protein